MVIAKEIYLESKVELFMENRLITVDLELLLIVLLIEYMKVFIQIKLKLFQLG
jgi:hypothetical protein